MTVTRLGSAIVFPPPEEAEPNGLLAVGGDLSPERLLLAYSLGIFPWYEDGLPILWHSPDPRMALRPPDLHLTRSLKRALRGKRYLLSADTAFERVVRRCAEISRPGQQGSWITHEMIGAYVRLHELGFAHSIEAWLGDQLAGGLYGVALGSCFFGESMFAEADDASKVAFATLVHQLERWEFTIVDCQVYTEHLERFGATEWPRPLFLEELSAALRTDTRRGPWQVDSDLAGKCS
ncbi:MAG: leucyl/phenylalanyl-tRNA--protein transferase [Myxococcota bacterium]|jgi:leucyl/phenylalanyl-tRNA--protein transferase|nr:leucyl/phenylalanyl-tRNA--protein transferase [Deltaproteobacteria bacterium]MCP4239745.1 leucyl/phenylalanyl-tRNA--protein transferase [bacterium]MDP6074463.1 leucyl/phenylalanyl-tRNA--protein transferase [Myxococcota bacterium]MDP6241707.1 leucyl/phenylalanyl-tRNA--protein transferase [Myxococcota bacterium]MDP7073848.1 leucyl/phenylalanyl-tRNA--protein transferase [Myxococcota bacterium]